MIEQNINELNQIFLTDYKIIKKIIESSDLSKKDNVLEIGPGKGDLTKELSNYVNKVTALEIDKKLSQELVDMPENVEVFFIDAKVFIKKNLNKSYNKIIASPPYNILEPLLKILINKNSFDLLVLVTPIYFLDKMRRNPIFSSFFNFEKISDVLASSFNPIPRIDSEIIKITKKQNLEIEKDDSSYIVRSIYLQDSKIVKNAIRTAIIGLNKNKYNKELTKNNSRDIVKSLNLNENLLNKKVTNLNLEDYKIIKEKF